MIQTESILNVVDNSRATHAKCIKVLKGNYARVGDIVLVSLRYVKPAKKNQKVKVKKGQICKALLIRTRNKLRRKSGFDLTFANNSVILLNNKLQPVASRAFGPTIQELRGFKNFKIISMISYLV